MSTPIAIVLDDFGMDGRIDDAAIALVETGRISGISCMAGAPGWPAAAVRLRTLGGYAVDIGLHLDLTAWPLTLPARPLWPWIGDALTRRLDAQALQQEIRAQLDAFEDAHGRPPDHVDGHQHVHQLPQVREALLDELARRGGVRPWLRDTRAARVPGGALTDAAKARVIEALGAAGLRRAARRAGLRSNAHLLGVYGFSGGAERFAERMQTWIAATTAADLIVTHAARDSVPGDVLDRCRPDEYRVLAGSGWPEDLARADRMLRPMSHILAARTEAPG